MKKSEWIVRQFHFSFGGKIYPRKRAAESERPFWIWTISSNIGLEFLKVIKTYLRLKKLQAELAMDYQEAQKARGRRQRTEEELAVAEVTKILMGNMNKPKRKSY